MRVGVSLLAVLGLSSPALAQQALPAPAPATTTAPAPATTTAPAQAPAKPTMVKKVVCERVDVEETTGSRLGAAPKKCRTIEVPANAGGGGSRNAPRPERGGR
jgi:hypothetical protein